MGLFFHRTLFHRLGRTGDPVGEAVIDRITILQGDCLEVLKTLPDQSVQCCITSPPYFGLRDYGTATWEGGDSGCEHVKTLSLKRNHSGGLGVSEGMGRGTQSSTASSTIQFRDTCGKCGATRIDAQIGLEATPQAYVDKLVEVFSEVWRVLKDDGLFWAVIGDSYAGGGGGNYGNGKNVVSQGGQQVTNVRNRASWLNANNLPPKSLMMIPARVAIALQDDGWVLRQEIVWAKTAPMPESVTDRCTRSHEMVYMLAKQPRYYYDAESVKEPCTSSDDPRNRADYIPNRKRNVGGRTDGLTSASGAMTWPQGGRNKRSVWTLGPEPFSDAHFATYPTALVKPMVMASTRPGDVVLDPFAGSGTTLKVALELGRKAVGIELNPAYVTLIEQRTNVTPAFL